MYDAHEVMASKDEMAKYPITLIKKNDLVVVETKVTRYHTKDADNKWSNQRVQMELLAVSLLHYAQSPGAAEQRKPQEIVGLHI